jgi:hypothetical protein
METNAKLKELVLYISARMAGDKSSGSIKRNKALAFADFSHYAKHGKSITGATYLKQQFGPAPRGVKRLEQELCDNDEAAQVIVQDGTRVQKMLFPKREADLDGFTGAEIASVADALDLLERMTGMEASDLSHEEMLGWKYAREREEIPYETVFLYDGPVTSSDREAAKRLVERLGTEMPDVQREPTRA